MRLLAFGMLFRGDEDEGEEEEREGGKCLAESCAVLRVLGDGGTK